MCSCLWKASEFVFRGDHLRDALQASFATVCFPEVQSMKEKTEQLITFFLVLEFTQDLRNSDIGTLFTLRDWLHSHHRPLSALTEQTNEDNMVSRIRQFRIRTPRSNRYSANQAQRLVQRSAWLISSLLYLDVSLWGSVQARTKFPSHLPWARSNVSICRNCRVAVAQLMPHSFAKGALPGVTVRLGDIVLQFGVWNVLRKARECFMMRTWPQNLVLFFFSLICYILSYRLLCT